MYTCIHIHTYICICICNPSVQIGIVFSYLAPLPITVGDVAKSKDSIFIAWRKIRCACSNSTVIQKTCFRARVNPSEKRASRMFS